MTTIRVVIPFKYTNAKSRLSGLLSREERQKLAEFMLVDVVDSLFSLSSKPQTSSHFPSISPSHLTSHLTPEPSTSLDLKITIVSTTEIDIPSLKPEVAVKIDPRNLNDCVNEEIERGVPLAVIMSDLPLLSQNVLERFFRLPGDVVITPGRKGGTNMLLVRKKGFKVSYHYGSFFNHIKMAEKLGFTYTVYDSFYASIDIDDESDLLELLLHGKGKKSYSYLTELGFYVVFRKVPELRRA
jgi:2-phospho-L-lactate guanylyltransferase